MLLILKTNLLKGTCELQILLTGHISVLMMEIKNTLLVLDGIITSPYTSQRQFCRKWGEGNISNIQPSRVDFCVRGGGGGVARASGKVVLVLTRP